MVSFFKKRKVIALQGFPGIGNVGKLLIDYLVRFYKPEKVKKITSNYLPNIVFVREQNLIEPPQIILYKKSLKDLDLLLLSGNVQPNDDYSAYVISDLISKELAKENVSQLIAFGGIGLPVEPENPKLFIAGTDKQLVEAIKKKYKLKDFFGIVTHISGLAGLVPLSCEKRGISSIIIIAETFANPFYLGIPSTRAALKFVKKYLNLEVNVSKFDKEFTIKTKKKIKAKTEQTPLNEVNDLSYIG